MIAAAAAADASSFFARNSAASLRAATAPPPLCRALPRTLALLMSVLFADEVLVRGRTFAAAAAVKAATPCPELADEEASSRPLLWPFPRAAAVVGAAVPRSAAFGGGGRIRKPTPPLKKPMSPGLAVGGRRAAGRADGDFTAPPFLALVADERAALEAATAIRVFAAAVLGLAQAPPLPTATRAVEVVCPGVGDGQEGWRGCRAVRLFQGPRSKYA